MAAFLSPEWLRDLDAAARRALHGTGPGDGLVVEQRVTDSPYGEVSYHLVFSDEVRVVPGPAVDPDVVLVSDYLTAVDLQRGRLNAQHAIAHGRMKLRGHVEVLLRDSEVLRTLGDLFQDLRARTETPGAEDGHR